MRRAPTRLTVLLAIAALGAAALIVGALNALRGNEISGVAIAAGQVDAGALGGDGAPPSIGEYPTGAPFTSAPKPSIGSIGSTGRSTAGQHGHQVGQRQPANSPRQSNPVPNTIELADGSTAHLVHASVTDDGDLPIPNGVRDASWWGAGLTASTGATVFAGHVNWAGSIGPFASLWSTPAGSSISVVGANGAAHRYRVTTVLTVDKSQLPRRAGELFDPAGPRRIVLVTCGGEWVGGETGYAANRIVIATPA